LITWAKLATFPWNGELLFGRARQVRTHGFGIDSIAVHGAVPAFALHALAQVGGLAVVVKDSVKKTLLCKHDTHEIGYSPLILSSISRSSVIDLDELAFAFGATYSSNWGSTHWG